MAANTAGAAKSLLKAFKYDVGTYAYGEAANDNNGGRSLVYSSFDNPTSITKGNHKINFNYAPNRSRYATTRKKNYGDRIDDYTITKPPGFDGPEVVSTRKLSIGSTLKIKKILRCNNCLFSSPIVILVDILSENLNPEAPAVLYGLRTDSMAGLVTL